MLFQSLNCSRHSRCTLILNAMYNLTPFFPKPSPFPYNIFFTSSLQFYQSNLPITFYSSHSPPSSYISTLCMVLQSSIFTSPLSYPKAEWIKSSSPGIFSFLNEFFIVLKPKSSSMRGRITFIQTYLAFSMLMELGSSTLQKIKLLGFLLTNRLSTSMAKFLHLNQNRSTLPVSKVSSSKNMAISRNSSLSMSFLNLRRRIPQKEKQLRVGLYLSPTSSKIRLSRVTMSVGKPPPATIDAKMFQINYFFLLSSLIRMLTTRLYFYRIFSRVGPITYLLVKYTTLSFSSCFTYIEHTPFSTIEMIPSPLILFKTSKRSPTSFSNQRNSSKL